MFECFQKYFRVKVLCSFTLATAIFFISSSILTHRGLLHFSNFFLFNLILTSWLSCTAVRFGQYRRDVLVDRTDLTCFYFRRFDYNSYVMSSKNFCCDKKCQIWPLKSTFEALMARYFRGASSLHIWCNFQQKMTFARIWSFPVTFELLTCH